MPAAAYSRHNTVTPETIGAQQMLSKLQGQNGIRYTGGWTHGAGLHEETLGVPMETAQRLRGYIVTEFQPRRGRAPAVPAHVTLHTYNPDDPAYVPKYIRNALGAGPVEAAPAGFWDWRRRADDARTLPVLPRTGSVPRVRRCRITRVPRLSLR